MIPNQDENRRAEPTQDERDLSWPITGTPARRRIALLGLVLAGVVLSFYNLTSFPVTWFDEGSHLHVPKTLVRFGVYADYSSEGFRHYGPTLGVGPTVMLPIAAAFKMFGIGLLQARIVMVLYMLAATLAFFNLARFFGGGRTASVATALLVSSRAVTFVAYGRQVLGEVPAFLYLCLGLLVWFHSWRERRLRDEILAGVLFGLAIVTKYQLLIMLVPTMGLCWLADVAYYRALRLRAFFVPLAVACGCFGIWQVCLIVYLGPATASENYALLREATAGAAAAFSPRLMARSARELLSLKTYFGWLIPALIYGCVLASERSIRGLRWAVLLALATTNFGWYVLASVSWIRYAFVGLAITSVFVSVLFDDLIEAVSGAPGAGRGNLPASRRLGLGTGLRIWLIAMIGIPLAVTVREVLWPPFNAPRAMAAYLNDNVPSDALIESWEPEMGFLSDHHIHFPPASLLPAAVRHIWFGAASPSTAYDFVARENPPYVLRGQFARWVDLYPEEVLRARYTLVVTIGGYQLWARH